MVPILYESTITNFSTNGLCRLPDCVKCTVTEERNGIYECEFDYPVNGRNYDKITEGRIISVTHDEAGDRQPFIIYARSEPINGIVTFNAHHVSYKLAHIILRPFSATSVAAAFELFETQTFNEQLFSFWTDKASAGNFSIKYPRNNKEILGGVEGSILDRFGGGEYEWDGYTVKLYQHRGSDNGVTIRYGKNLADMQREYSVLEVYNAVLPFWHDANGENTVYGSIIAGDGGIIMEAPWTNENGAHITTENSVDIEFGYFNEIVVTLDLSNKFQEAPTVNELMEAAQAHLRTAQPWLPDENIKVDFVAMWQTDEYADVAPLQRVRLCDTVTVYNPMLNVNAKLKCIKTVWNVLHESYDEIELGKAKTSFADTLTVEFEGVLEEYPSISMMQGAINHATELITGGLGGHVVFTLNGDGQPEEILIMDTADVATAMHVLRINVNGIGFSSTGINGPYTSAWTLDGHFVADFITAGTMLANRIRGGTLALGGNNNGNGTLVVYDASGNIIGQWNNLGLSATGDLIVKNGCHTAQFTDITYPVMTLGEGITWETTKGYSVDVKGLSQNLISGKYIAPQTSGAMYEVEISTNHRVCSNKYVCIDGTDRNVGVMFAWAYQNYGNCVELTRVGLDGTNYLSLIRIAYTASSNSALMYVSGRQLAFVSSSARRYKHDIKPIEDPELDPHKLLDLPVVQFGWNGDHNLQYEDMRGKVIPGIIAEDVEKIYPAATIHNEDGEVESWDERRIIPGMLALIQEQQKTIESLEARLAKLEEVLLKNENK